MNMPLVSMNRRRRIGGAATPVFSPSALFALAEPGVWYDPSDLTTLFQDTAGTTPVTTPGQTVALALDKSKGLVLGPELVANGTFDSGTTGWSSSTLTSTATVVNGEFVVSAAVANGRQVSAISCQIGRTYQITGSARVTSGTGTAVINVSDTTAATSERAFLSTASSSPTILRAVFVATQTTHYVGVGNAGSGTGDKTFDNISVKELPGFHATQATLASRPTYGIVPLGGRRNLLTYSEDFSNAAYVTVTSGGSVTRTASEISFPATTSSSSVFVIRQAFTSLASNYTGSVELRAKAAGDVGKKVGLWLNDGSITNFTWHTLTSNWVRITVTESMSAASSFWNVGIVGDTAVGGVIQGGVTVEIRNAQLETGSSATAYQRVGSAFDVTEAGVASLSYLFFEISDFLQTPAINFTGTDAMTVWAGLRKNSDTARGTVVELTASAAANNGAFHLTAPNAASATYAFESKGTTLTDAVATGVTAPITSVLCGYSDISLDQNILRVNGVQADSDTGDQGTGTFSNAIMYIGMRAGTSLPANMQLYSLIVRGAATDVSTIGQGETWVNGKTGAYT